MGRLGMMRAIRGLLIALALLAPGAAHAASTINPNIPATNAPLQSLPIRNNFLAAATDVNNLLGKFGGTTAPNNPSTFQDWVNTGTTPYQFNFYDGAQWVTWGYLNASTHTFQTAASCSICAVTNATNTFTAYQIIDLNTATLQAAQTGTMLQVGNANGVVSRIEADAFAAAAHFSGVRFNGSVAGPTVIVSGNEIVSINAFGYDAVTAGVATGPWAAFRCYGEDTWSSTLHGTYCDIAVTAGTASATLAESIRFENDAGITVPSTVTGGDQGAGTINAGGLYVNGVAVATASIAAGAANDIPYYTAANTIGALAAAANSVLVTDGSGVPSISTTLPSGLVIPGYAQGPGSSTIGCFAPWANTTGTLLGNNCGISFSPTEITFSLGTINQQAPASAPGSICALTDYAVAFTCDLSKLAYAIGTNITGTATLGEPSTGYLLTPNLSSTYTYLSNSSGWNQDTGDNGGRTGAAAHFTVVQNLGQGDAGVQYASVYVDGAKSGATNFLANPAGTFLYGQIFAGQAGVYLQGLGDLNFNDNGFDVAAIADVRNFQRTVNTAALGEVWMGYRIGTTASATKAIDVGVSLTGLEVVGLDTTQATLSGAAVNLATSQKIVFNSTASAIGGINWYGNTIGDSEIYDNSGVLTLQGHTGASGGISTPGYLNVSGALIGFDAEFGSPTSGLLGSGKINVAANYYINGAVAATTVNGQTCALAGTCTVAAAAGTLTGSTLASNVTASSLTSAATAFTAGALVTASDHVTDNGYLIVTGSINGSTYVRSAPQAFTSLGSCTSGQEGEMSAVNDSTTTTWGATITGSSAGHVLAYCDGTNWTVAAK